MKEYSAERKGGDDSTTKAAETPVKAEPKANVGGRGIKASGERGALTGSAWTFGKLRAPGGPADPKRAQQARSGPEAALTAAQVAGRRRLNAMVVAQLKASTGIDLSHVFVETDPQLAQQGKAGAAIGGKEIHVAPGHEEDTALLAHEAGHIVQQMPLSARGSAEQKGPDDEAGRAASGKPPGADNEAAPDGAGAGVEKGATDLEAEADAVATAVLSGTQVEVQGIGTGVLYEESEVEVEGDEESPSASKLEVSNVLFDLGDGQFVALDELKAHLADLDAEAAKAVLDKLNSTTREYDIGDKGAPKWATLEFCLSKVEGDLEAVSQLQEQVHALEAELDEAVREETEQRAAQLAAMREGVDAASSGVEGGVQDGQDAADDALVHVSINQKLGYQAGAIELVRKALGLSASSVVDEELVLALRARADLPSDILEHATLLALAPELVSAGDLSAKAKAFYREKGQTDKKGRPIGADHNEVIREHYETQEAEQAKLAAEQAENSEPPVPQAGAEATNSGDAERDASSQAMEEEMEAQESAGGEGVSAPEAPPSFAAGEPYATLLKELGLSADAAFDNLSELDAAINEPTQKKKLTVEVSDVFVERALIWQIEAHLGLTLDAMLGTDSLVLMGLNTVTSAYARWNVDNLEPTKEDPVLKEAIANLPEKRQGEVNAQTDYTHKKRLGDVTGDDGVTFGMAHFTSVGKLLAFFHHIQKHWLEQQAPGAKPGDALRMQANPLNVHFGVDLEAEPPAAATAAQGFLGLDENETADNAVLVRLRNTPAPNGGTLLDRYLAFCRDPDQKRLQLSFNEKKAKTVFAGATVGTAVMIKLIGSSSGSGRAVQELRELEKETDKTKIPERQMEAGLLYIKSGPEEAPYKKVANKVWEKALNEKSLGGLTQKKLWSDEVGRQQLSVDDTALAGRKPTQKLERLLNLIDVYGPTWDKEYTK